MPAPIGRAPGSVVARSGTNDMSRVATRPAAVPARATGWSPSTRPAAQAVRAPAVELPDDIRKTDDGTPIFTQGDARWGRTRLGHGTTIARSGCAMSSTAMAMSKITGEPITPDALNGWLAKNRGYAGDAMDWSRVGKARGLEVRRENFRLSTIDAHLEAGKPVVIGVDYKAGSNGGANGTDHWICVTAKGTDDQGRTVYFANDPGTGKVVTLAPSSRGGLSGDGKNALGHYRTTGQLRVFSDPKPVES